jgi:phosphoglycerate kinase
MPLLLLSNFNPMAKLSIKDFDLRGKRVFIRVDFNVPLANGGQEITSDKRIRASLPTIQYALEQGAAVILASHLGRPKGKPNPEMSMKPVGAKLSELLGKPVTVAPDCVGPQVEAILPKPGEVLLLENLRYHAEEEANDPGFSQQLAKLCDVYVNDAFGSAHRAHASTVGMIQFVKKAAGGLLMDQELKYLGMATKNPARRPPVSPAVPKVSRPPAPCSSPDSASLSAAPDATPESPRRPAPEHIEW